MRGAGAPPAMGRRVLHLLSGGEKGGIARVVSAVSTAPQPANGEVVIGVLGESGADLPGGVRVVSFGRTREGSVRAARNLLGFVRREGIGLIHTHNVTANLYGLMLKALSPGLAHVIHVHAHYSHVLVETQRSRWKRELLLRGNARALRRCDRVIAISESIKSFLVERGVEAAKIEVIHNAIDVGAVESQARRQCPAAAALTAEIALPPADGAAAATRPPVVGVVGRLAPVKNYSLFLEAARLVLREEKAAFVLVGEGPDKGRLERQAADLGIAGRVRFAGWVANPYPLLAAMDVVVLTSNWEGFGLVLLEAMALERPVVATAVGAVREIVRDGETGLLAPAGDAEAIAASVLRLLRDPALRRSLGARGKQVAGTEFSLTAMREKVERVYRSALERRAVRAGALGLA